MNREKSCISFCIDFECRDIRLYGINVMIFSLLLADSNFRAIMTGLLYILVFYAAGELLSRLTGGVVSGGVIGMVLLFAALTCGAVKPERVRDISRMLLGNMSIFFIPLGVGIIASYDLVAANLWSIIVASAVSTLLVIAVVGIVQQKIGRRL